MSVLADTSEGGNNSNAFSEELLQYYNEMNKKSSIDSFLSQQIESGTTFILLRPNDDTGLKEIEGKLKYFSDKINTSKSFLVEINNSKESLLNMQNEINGINANEAKKKEFKGIVEEVNNNYNQSFIAIQKMEILNQILSERRNRSKRGFDIFSLFTRNVVNIPVGVLEDVRQARKDIVESWEKSNQLTGALNALFEIVQNSKINSEESLTQAQEIVKIIKTSPPPPVKEDEKETVKTVNSPDVSESGVRTETSVQSTEKNNNVVSTNRYSTDNEKTQQVSNNDTTLYPNKENQNNNMGLRTQSNDNQNNNNNNNNNISLDGSDIISIWKSIPIMVILLVVSIIIA